MRIETRVEKFPGITNDPRDPSDKAQMITGFDITTDSRRMVPHRDSESGDSAASTSQKQNFCIALRTGTTYRLYGLGVVSGTGRAEVLMKDLTTGSSSDLGDDGWATPSNNQSSAGATSFALFVYYKKTGLIYGARAGSQIWAFDPSSVSAWADSHQALSYTNIAQGLVHSKDDVLYVPYDNKIAKNDNGSWTTAALTLPSHLYITSITERGNFLAIACAHLAGVGKSTVYLWDRDSSLTTLSDSQDWGEGVLKVLEQDSFGELVGVTLAGGDSTRFRHRVIIRSPGYGTIEMTSTTSPVVLQSKQRVDDKIYFLMVATFNGELREGLWSVSKKGGQLVLNHERKPNNDTSIGNGALKGFFLVGDYTFISYTDNSATFGLSKTNDSASYTSTAVYEKRFITKGSDTTKKLIGVSVLHEPLPTAGQIVLKRRKDATTSWTTVYTLTTDDALSYDAVKNADGTQFTEHKEQEFRIESTGGAVPTGLVFVEEIVPRRKY